MTSANLPDQIQLGDVTIEVVIKDIANVHLSVLPPSGRVRLSAPQRANPETLRIFAISKLGWIRRQQKKLREQAREPEREYLPRESHYVWGRRYLLDIREHQAPPSVELVHKRMILRVRPGSDTDRMRHVVEAWYRDLIRSTLPFLLARWQPILGVKVERFFIQRMKTKWGSCNPTARTIRLNTELAKKPVSCLEYIVVHELIHLLEPTHSPRFVTLMDRHMPMWRHQRRWLNELPIREEVWR